MFGNLAHECSRFEEYINLDFSHIIAVHDLFDESDPVQDNAKFISCPATKKFASAFMKLSNINLINDVMKTLHDCGHKIDQVIRLVVHILF